jgi:hypothetical protein
VSLAARCAQFTLFIRIAIGYAPKESAFLTIYRQSGRRCLISSKMETKNLVFFGVLVIGIFYNSIFAKWPIPFEKQYYLSSCLSNSAANSFHFDRYSK